MEESGRNSHRTEKSYVHWIRRFVRFHNRRHPRKFGKVKIEAFLTHLALEHGDSTFERSSVAGACYPQQDLEQGLGHEVYMQYALTRKYAGCV